MDFFHFIIIYLTLIISVIGYGFSFSKIITKYNDFTNVSCSIGMIGIYGIFFLIFVSYLTNLVLPHNNIHNLIIIIFGILSSAYYFLTRRKNISLKYFLYSLVISLGLIFYFKSHDDFSYYHLSFITNLTLNKVQFGIGNFDPAFNHHSSLFFFHSLFKTFFTKDYFYFIGQLGIVVFANTILLENIFKKSKNFKINSSFYLSLLMLVFVNIFFYRLAEHGTDRSAQILFFLAFILTINIFEIKKFSNKIFEQLIIIFTLIVTLKSFYLLYSILLFLIYFKFFNFKKIFTFLKNFPILLFSTAVFLLMIFYNIAHSGCFIYPVSITCFDLFFWGYGPEKVSDYMTWYELWSKAGATPNYRVENIPYYLSGLNWVPNWIDNYFFNKFSDFFFGVLLTVIIFLITFKPKNIIFKNFRYYLHIYILLILLFLEWFLQHPSLRYGGYVLVFLIMTFPVAIFLDNQNFIYKKKINSIKFLVFLTLIVFFSRNVNRLIDENNVYKYHLLQSPYYDVQKKFYTMQRYKKKDFKEEHKCYPSNSLYIVKCKTIFGYNFYYNNEK